VEIPAKGPDPRVDPQATQKISRYELDEALRRTKSGTRPVVRSEPELASEDYSGPRDTSPEITIVRIDSVEVEAFDPTSLPRSGALPARTSPAPAAPPSTALPAVASATSLDVPAPLGSGAPPPYDLAHAGDGAHERSDGLAAPAELTRPNARPPRLHVTPRMAFVAGIVVAALVSLAAFVGFFAGRGLPRLHP
jgi:hypothetical protein